MLRGPYLLCKVILCIFSLFFCSRSDAQREREAVESPVLTVTSLGKPLVELGGKWQFHLGDNPRWAAPTFDDSSWAKLSVDKGWDVQGYPDTGGFAWYRRHVRFLLPGNGDQLALVPISPSGVIEVFWNGERIGSCGRFPPHERVIGCWDPLALPPTLESGEGVLAIRVWTIPSYGLIPPGNSGLATAPQVGHLDAVRAATDQQLYEYWRSGRAANVLAVVYAVASALTLLAFLADRQEVLYLWLALFLLGTAYHRSIPLLVEFGFSSWQSEQMLVFVFAYGLQFVSLWFLMLRLFGLQADRWWRRLSYAAMIVTVTLGILSCLPGFWLNSWTTSTATFERVTFWGVTLSQLYSLALIVAGIRKKQDGARWAVAITATLAVIWPVIYNMLQLLQRWDIADRHVNAPLFYLFGGIISVREVSEILLLLALGYAAIETLRQARRQRTETELELRSAEEVQHILMPDALPQITGFALTSAYRPANQVGGDFLQVVPLPDETTLVLIGDVSGKGLRAGMMVALITGAARTAAEADPNPAAILASLNRSLCGRLNGGFATSLALRLSPDGQCALANAGHLAPVLNSGDVHTRDALPLGLTPEAEYEQTEFGLKDGDTLTLYTDGVPEARNKRGELFGFERAALLISQADAAEEIAKRAQAFGQEDDITVLTIRRLVRARLGEAGELAGTQ